MGNFYVNLSVRSNNRDQIAEALKQARRVAYILPSTAGYTVVCDMQADTQNTQAIEMVGTLLSRTLTVPVFAVLNHDDDVLCYWLFQDGKLTDAYDSNPEYFGGEDDDSDSAEPNVQLLCTALSVPDAVDDVKEILSADDYLFAVDRYVDLAEALVLPASSIGMGFNYIDQGELPPGLTQADLLRVG